MLIRNVRLIDGTGEVREGVDILVRDGRFAEIGEGLAAEGEVVEAEGATAIPGLIDAHTHLSLTGLRGVLAPHRSPLGTPALSENFGHQPHRPPSSRVHNGMPPANPALTSSTAEVGK